VGKNNVIWLIAKAFLAFFFLLLFLYPLLLIIFKTIILKPETIELIPKIILSNTTLLWNSFFQATVSTFFAVLLGIPLAFIIARRSFPGKKILKSLSLIPFVFPSILVVVSFVIIFGNNGWINSFLKNYLFFPFHIQFLYGFLGIILAHVFYNFSLVARFVSSSWENLDISMKEAAKTLGANKLQVFLKITLPQLIPSILASASLVFIFTFTSFAIVLSLGGISFTTLEVEIFRQITRNLNFGVGTVLAFVQFLILLIVVLLYLFFSKKYNIKEKGFREIPKKLSLSTLQGFVETAFLVLSILFIILPIFSLVMFAFINSQTGEFSIRAFVKIFFSTNSSLLGTTPLHSVFFSLSFAFFASIIATFVALIASLKQTKIGLVEAFLSASIAISIITLGFGYLLGFGSGNFIVIILGHSILAFPFAFRIIKNALSKIDRESIDAARTLGANQWRVFLFVQLPRIKNAIIVSMAFCFAVSLGELGFVLILYDGIFATMPVYIYRLISTFDLGAATAMGLILVFISFISFYTIEHFSKDSQVF